MGCVKMRVSLTLKRLFEENHTTFLPDSEKAFVARVQLSNGKDYDAFHDVMTDAGFQREIKDSGGLHRKLPDATYLLPGQPEDTTPQSVSGKVDRAIKKFKKDTEQPDIGAEILVISAADVWFELEEMPED
jgi:hypothetical protein